jgi:basic membrane lipoprotein Med (substrate-binding protein (PBP1-ABC) superfamily)/DNA-binding SARP family transcriptional activator
MHFRILGPVEVVSDGGLVRLGSPKERALLGVLLLRRDEVVATPTLIDALWGERPPRTASHSLQSYVSRLRAVLGADRIRTQPPGYVLDVGPDDLDAARFETLVTAARDALSDGDPASASASLREALELWRGPPLADVASDLHVVGDLERLERLHAAAIEAWAEAELALGHHQEVLPELERLTAGAPLQEPLWSSRILALHRSGRSADALQVYERLRRTLADELGVDPSPTLCRLHERLLGQDPDLLLPAPDLEGAAKPARNPYKGLRAFTETDAADFFGREDLVRDLLEVLAEPGRRLLSVVGPSGSGKSSAVRAGLLPALRAGALHGSESWRITVMEPGPDPFRSVAGALGATTPSGWELQPGAPTREPGSGLLELTAGREPTLLVIDQFEELYTLPTHAIRDRFLDQLAAVLTSADGELRVVVTLRADLFDRPLGHPTFGRLFTAGLVTVHPLSPAQLGTAVVGPARVAGLTVDPALVTAVIADLAGQPGALPLFQYALTELCDHRRDGHLTADGYRAIGGVDGALTRRAEQLYLRLDDRQREAVRQLFLRLVRPAEHLDDTRRRTPLTEIAELEVDPLAMRTALDRCRDARLLTFARDTATGAPTVEVSHEALLRTWTRLGGWVEGARTDLRTRAALIAAVTEWEDADEDDGYLLEGVRLARYADWAATSSLRLTSRERRFLDASLDRRNRERATAEARHAAVEGRRRRASRRQWAIGLTAVAALAALTVALVTRPTGPLAAGAASVDRPEVVLVARAPEDGGFGALMADGLRTAGRLHEVRTAQVAPLADVADEVARWCEGGADLVLLGGGEYLEGLEAVPRCGDTTIAAIDAVGAPSSALDDVVSIAFSVEEGSFLVGVAAAAVTTSGVVGFVGGTPWTHIDEFRAGFEAGVAAVDPDVEVLATYVTHRTEPEHALEAYGNPGLGRIAAAQLFDRGADVIFAVAGGSGHGALQEAAARSVGADHRWIIGVDSDWHLTKPEPLRAHVLTSMLKRLDTAILDVVGDLRTGDLAAGERRYGVAQDGVDFSRRGGHLDRYLPELEAWRAAIVAGDLTVPRRAEGEVLPPATEATIAAEVELSFTGSDCTYQGPATFEEGDVLRAVVTNDGARPLTLVTYRADGAPPLDGVAIDLDEAAGLPSWGDQATVAELHVGPGHQATTHVGLYPGTTELLCADLEHGLAHRAARLEATPTPGG